MASTLNRELNTIKNLFRKAVEWGYLKESPAKPAKWIKTSKGIFRFLIQRRGRSFLWRFVRNPTIVHLHPIVAVALQHRDATRRNSQTADGRTLISRGQESWWSAGKTVTRRIMSLAVVPMNRILIEVLRKHPRTTGCPYVFCNAKGEPFTDVNSSFATAVNPKQASPF